MTTDSSWISKRPNFQGGDACIRNSRIPVWCIVNYRRLGATDEVILQAYPTLTPADLEAAFSYAAAHVEEIDTTIRENEKGEEGLVE
ncbi:MAG TPA: DUF433 domain-containing protein [Gemmataceae bacterium]|jgi:uncharacterized protein (DUF433 family)